MKIKSIYIIAEAGVNHNGSKKLAMEMVDHAVNAKANAIKFQTFKTDLIVTSYAKRAEYQKNNTKKNNTQHEMLKNLELSQKDFEEIYNYCVLRKIDFLSTAFDIESLLFLTKKLKLNKLKIPSGDLTNAPLLLEHSFRAKKLIVSTGMSTLSEIENALGVIAFGLLGNKKKPSMEEFKKAFQSQVGKVMLKEKVTLLHCTSAYPAPLNEINLKAMLKLQNIFKLDVGYSDHSDGIIVPLVAASLGARVIEKHFTLDKTLDGPDHKASIEPLDLKKMISEVRLVEKILGSEKKSITLSELKNQTVARKSLVAIKAIKKGDFFTNFNLGCKRPGNGMSPINYWHLIGKKSPIPYKKDELINHLL